MFMMLIQCRLIPVMLCACVGLYGFPRRSSDGAATVHSFSQQIAGRLGVSQPGSSDTMQQLVCCAYVCARLATQRL
jgi:hypothetical protein